MSLKSVFEKAVQKTRSFLNGMEASRLESRIEMAKAGYMLVQGVGNFNPLVPLSPEASQSMITVCQKRLAELRSPSPAHP